MIPKCHCDAENSHCCTTVVLVSTRATCLLALTIRRATTNISMLYAVSVSLTVISVHNSVS
jgi:hypothetical protein